MRGSGIGTTSPNSPRRRRAVAAHPPDAGAQGTQPIHPRVGQPAQLRAFNNLELPAFRYMQPIFGSLLAPDWTMFDLRPLRWEWNVLGVRDAELAALVFGYDILVIVPEATPTTGTR